MLCHVDILCAEDTRVTAQLLRLYHCPTPKLISLREHNEREQSTRILEYLSAGKKVALVSDAGTPAISDPGARLVRSAHEAGFKVSPIVGASALTAAISVAGLDTTSVLFYGFLPPKSAARRKILAQWQKSDHAIVIYEAPHRLIECLQDLRSELGAARELTLAREMTKTFETIVRFPADKMLDFVRNDANQQRGEAVLVINAAPKTTPINEDEARAAEILAILLKELPTKQAAHLASEITGVKKNRLYSIGLALKETEKIQQHTDKNQDFQKKTQNLLDKT